MIEKIFLIFLLTFLIFPKELSWYKFFDTRCTYTRNRKPSSWNPESAMLSSEFTTDAIITSKCAVNIWNSFPRISRGKYFPAPASSWFHRLTYTSSFSQMSSSLINEQFLSWNIWPENSKMHLEISAVPMASLKGAAIRCWYRCYTGYSYKNPHEP